MVLKELSEKEKHQERAFDNKAGKHKIYVIGGRDNRNHEIKIKAIIEALVTFQVFDIKQLLDFPHERSLLSANNKGS